MSTSPTLVVMAAGMGSRYGGLKQIESVGPSGEIVIDYSVYDAIRAGFGKVVFVIRRDIEAEFREVIERNIAGRIPVEYAFQSLDDIPPGYAVPGERTKPWGTAHAIYSARHRVQEPFSVINADDYYGAESFKTIANQLKDTPATSTDYCLVAYVASNTLSENGSVTRGVCRIEDGKLREVIERMEIEAHDGAARYKDGDRWVPMTGNEPVSMNIWGFTPIFFDALGARLPAFMDQVQAQSTAEFLIPDVVDELINSGQATVHALHSNEKWLGVTYPEDKPTVTRGIQALVDAGAYPENLWG